jgi:hypothetical protein
MALSIWLSIALLPSDRRKPELTRKATYGPKAAGSVFYGQRLAVSSQPAARAGCGAAATAGCGMRIGCCELVEVASVGLGASANSLSSDKRGAATRSASTSFSSLASSSSFCLRTSYTFFIRWPLRRFQNGGANDRTLCRPYQFVKKRRATLSGTG